MSTKKSSNKIAAKPANVQPIIDKAKAAIPPEERAMFDKVVLSGMRIMFDPGSKHMTDEMLERPGPLATRLTEGIITLVYLLWNKSNKTIPPKLIVPATLVLTCEAFRYVQESQDPEATAAVLGEAIAGATQGVMDRFGATQDKIPALMKAQGGAKPAAPEPGGLLSAATGKS